MKCCENCFGVGANVELCQFNIVMLLSLKLIDLIDYTRTFYKKFNFVIFNITAQCGELESGIHETETSNCQNYKTRDHFVEETNSFRSLRLYFANV